MALTEGWRELTARRVREAVSRKKRDLPFVERLRKSLERNRPILDALRPDDHEGERNDQS